MRSNNISIKTILGIDPGIEKLGIAILKIENNKEEVIFSNCFKTSKNLSDSKRLSLIYKYTKDIIKKYPPDLVVMEKIFFTVNQKTVIRVAEARGVILSLVGENDLNFIEMSPTVIKQSITGYGKATKNDIIKMIPKIVKYDKQKFEDDEIDAIAIALTGQRMFRYSQFF